MTDRQEMEALAERLRDIKILSATQDGVYTVYLRPTAGEADTGRAAREDVLDSCRERLSALREQHRQKMNSFSNAAEKAAAEGDMSAVSINSTESERHREAFSALNAAIDIFDTLYNDPQSSELPRWHELAAYWKDRAEKAKASTTPAPGAVAEPVAWPEPKITNPDIADPTGVPYIDGLIHQVLDAQQDINFHANSDMNQSLANVAGLMDEVERALRMVSRHPAPSDGAIREALEYLLEYVEQNECRHEETRRGGAIWTICDGCGQKWADDRGGFVPYREPDAISRARRALSLQPQAEKEG